MKGLREIFGGGIWTANLVLLASAVFLNRFGQGLLGGARTNFFIDTLGLSGGQVLFPGLAQTGPEHPRHAGPGGQLRDVAYPIVLLCSDRMGYVVGEDLNVSAGQVIY